MTQVEGRIDTKTSNQVKLTAFAQFASLQKVDNKGIIEWNIEEFSLGDIRKCIKLVGGDL